MLLTYFIFCSNTDILATSGEQSRCVKFKIDIIRSAGITQFCVGLQRKAANMSTLSWMKRYTSDSWV